MSVLDKQSRESGEGGRTGETIAWNETHAPLFETGAERYAWLSSAVTVAVNEPALDPVDYRVYRIG
ncbi:DUF3237 family protein [Nonomuraea sp. CA-218870]|uniref:DUF3237 family protein n=1 Tax=Nonomuraea sp. CA-218870 TaxID=3239998 RepID=UPI003D8E67F0